MRKALSLYLVRADILGQPQYVSASAVLVQGEPVRRRINRLERATESCRGKVIRRAPQGFLASFETAEAAVHGACEMQRRCAVIPQMSGTRVGVQIGIHAATADQFANDSTGAIEATAARLAALIGDGGVVVSGAVLNALSPQMRQNLYSVPDGGAGTPAHAIDWQGKAIAAVARVAADSYPVVAVSSVNPCIVLRYDGLLFQFGDEQPAITIGRDPTSNIVVSDPKASRSHCRIINQWDRCVLVDQSTNGTAITSAEGPVVVIKHELAGLRGRGWITLGHRFGTGEAHAIEFEVRSGEI